MSIFFIGFLKLNAQNYNFPNLYSEKILFNPSYSGLTELSEFNLNYSKNFYSDIYSGSFNRFFEKYHSGLGFLISNNRLGKNAINNINISGIYSYRIQINYRSLINTAVQISYFEQSINSENLIFSNQINPLTQTIGSNTSEFFNKTYRTYDFSFGTSYISNKYRIGISLHHADKLFNQSENNQLKPQSTIHFGKVFSVKLPNKSKKLLVTPEIIWLSQNNFHQIIYAVHGIYNIFLTRFFLKQNLKLNTFEGIVGIGIKYLKFRISYTYSISFTKYLSIPTSSNGITLQYNIGKQKKINSKNTIYCSNF